ncbi:MAG: helix-turn-helix domain-containing protein [Lachnospiraceae bacterium]|nr:helix-turn-helix domain-containing protein [Lachnospiraceae bacterium]
MNHTIGEIISIERQNRNMTQEEFASRLGVTPQAVSKWERGSGLPDVSLLSGICQILRISADRLLSVQEDFLSETICTENNDRYRIWSDTVKNLIAEPLAVEFHPDLVPCFETGLKGDLIDTKRFALSRDFGILIPTIRIRDNTLLKEKEFIIKSYDNILYREILKTIDENTYQYIVTKICDTCMDNYSSILNKQIVKAIIDSVKENYPGAADGLVPERISYLAVKDRLQTIIQENGNFHDIIHILEEMERELPST